ncbi:MAG: cytochrome bc complex cytochrome b subunit, partial [Candidatus Latescibacteria bacterium]|nr:cytochrome bc complex cytochrome b subunit [Candidatus Latescibacterota bacterium]
MEPPGGRKRSLLGWIETRVNLTEIVSFLSAFGLLPTELDTRKPLREAMREAFSQPLPSYARWPNILGILSFILFLFLAVSGTMMAFYYQPTAEVAYSSATAIARDVSFGSLIHQVHRWAATLFLLVLAARVVRFFLAGLYASGREVIWMVAVLSFVVGTFSDLTGRLLPWTAGGYWTTVRAREVIDALPLIGPTVSFLVGGSGLDSLVLTRFYVLHIVVFPVTLVCLFFLHFSSIRRVGMSRIENAPKSRSLRVAMYDVILIVVFLVGGLITLAVLWPHPFDVVADPFSTPPNARPPWYLLAPHALLDLIPSIVPRFLRGLALVLLLAGVR